VVSNNVSITKVGQIDLLSEDGEFARISQRPYARANLTLEGRQTYVLIKVMDARKPKYISLLNNLEQVNPGLAERLENLSSHDAESQEKIKSSKSRARSNQRRPSLFKMK